ncbi:MAG TPA: SDR family oxidoreductase [Gemmatimonadaceae bacterium]|jgi:pteridine reductase|nr:SDR family oxidoreductase [Gemmatimonadaceae bacterium]
MDPNGRVALVTGGARRVGRALALALADRGARVAIHHHESPEQAASLVEQLAERGIEAAAFASDLRKADAPDRLIAQVVQRFGSLDILVNSAAIMVRRSLDELTPDDWDDTFALNLRAPFFCARAAARAMADRGGVIVNLADLAGIETWPAYAAHGISKAGVIHMTRVLARILAPRVRVNAIAPGAVLLPESWSADDAAHLERTTPLRRLGSPNDVAQAMLYFIEADYVTGDLLIVDGGRHIR